MSKKERIVGRCTGNAPHACPQPEEPLTVFSPTITPNFEALVALPVSEPEPKPDPFALAETGKVGRSWRTLPRAEWQADVTALPLPGSIVQYLAMFDLPLFDPFERKIRKEMARLARQRVRLVLQPGNVLVYDKAPAAHDDTAAILETCIMRGWVEVLQTDVPSGDLAQAMKAPVGQMFTDTVTRHRLTDSGWSAINRAHMWTVFAAYVGFLSLLIALLTWLAIPPLASGSTDTKDGSLHARSAMAKSGPLQEPDRKCENNATFKVPYRC